LQSKKTKKTKKNANLYGVITLTTLHHTRAGIDHRLSAAASAKAEVSSNELRTTNYELKARKKTHFSHNFSNIFERFTQFFEYFTQLFEYFQTFSNVFD